MKSTVLVWIVAFCLSAKALGKQSKEVSKQNLPLSTANPEENIEKEPTSPGRKLCCGGFNLPAQSFAQGFPSQCLSNNQFCQQAEQKIYPLFQQAHWTLPQTLSFDPTRNSRLVRRHVYRRRFPNPPYSRRSNRTNVNANKTDISPAITVVVNSGKPELSGSDTYQSSRNIRDQAGKTNDRGQQSQTHIEKYEKTEYIEIPSSAVHQGSSQRQTGSSVSRKNGSSLSSSSSEMILEDSNLHHFAKPGTTNLFNQSDLSSSSSSASSNYQYPSAK